MKFTFVLCCSKMMKEMEDGNVVFHFRKILDEWIKMKECPFCEIPIKFKEEK